MRIRAVLIDIDGVLTVSWQPLPGAVAALERLRAAALPLALVTKYLPAAHRDASGTPDHVLGSFAGLPALLERLA
jgi:ribonucleotide monophosphatase NagD (HAD superfamily)